MGCVSSGSGAATLHVVNRDVGGDFVELAVNSWGIGPRGGSASLELASS